jgi:hypothetical protein
MDSVNDLEKRAWAQIAAATERRDARAIAHYSVVAPEIAEKKSDWAARLDPLWIKATVSTIPRQTANAPIATGNYTGRPIRAFVLHGKRHPVSTYKDLLVSLANLLRDKHSPEKFDETVSTFEGRKRRYFSEDPDRLKYAQPLKGGGPFVETNLNANLIVNNICVPMVRELEGHCDFQVDLGDNL